ncbi:hypothetical protein F9L07_07980 [Pimelobacter simplex]|uniref:Exo-alpha-sialidase n=1 Tax=Nocardioides simplex TaxID=2045 RepID=A0A7J5E0J1_NOCSI|nr:hypothetical protein [Pimelobacter simplex]KAB2811780.1 hypothetical protein F9L07_07980 [Pimelobacter simplex]
MTPRHRRSALVPLLAVVLLLLVAAGCSERRPEPPAPAEAEVAVEAEAAVVDAPDASLLALVVTPGAVERRVSVWQDRADDSAWTLALTDDSYATRRLLEVPAGTQVAALGAGRYALREGWDGARLRVVGADPAADVAVRLGRRPGPLAAGEALLVRGDPGRLRLIGVAADGRAHPVPAPKGLSEVGGQGAVLDGLAFAGPTAYHRSDDGGATWQRSVLGEGPGFLAMRVPGAVPVVLEGSDGATLFPLVAVWRAGTTWTRTAIHPGGRAHLTTTGGWVGADGVVRVLATRWDAHETSGRSGVWRVVGDRLERVASDQPRVTDVPEAAPLLVEPGARPAVWVAGTPGTAWRSQDDGAHWTRFATR